VGHAFHGPKERKRKQLWWVRKNGPHSFHVTLPRMLESGEPEDAKSLPVSKNRWKGVAINGARRGSLLHMRGPTRWWPPGGLRGEN